MFTINFDREMEPVHSGPVAGVACHGDAVYAVSYDGRLSRWHMAGGKLQFTKSLYLHTKGANCVAVSPCGKYLATGGSDGAVCVLDSELRREPALRMRHEVDVECLVFSPDSSQLFSGGTDSYGRIFDVSTGEQTAAIQHGRTVGSACRHVLRDLIVTGCNDNKLRIIRWCDGTIVAEAEGHTGPIKAVCVCAIGILSGGHDRRLLLHDFGLQVFQDIARFSTTPKFIASSPDGHSVWVGVYDQHLRRYVVTDSGLVLQADVFSARSWAHGLACDNARAVIGSFDGAPIICDDSTTNVDAIDRVPPAVPSISSSATAKQNGVITGGDSGVLYLWKPDGSQQVLARTEGPITSIVGDDNDLVVGTWDGVLSKFVNGAVQWTARWPGRADQQRAACPILRVARDGGRILAGLYTSGWACFNDSDGSLAWQVKEATGAVKSVDMRDGVFAVTGRYDPLRVGDVSTGRVRIRSGLETPVSDVVSICPFGSSRTRIAACAEANQVWVFDLVRTDENWDLCRIYRSPGRRLPIKAILWLDEDTLLAGDYGGQIHQHRVGGTSRLSLDVKCRLGISSLTRVSPDELCFTTFDGDVGRLKVRRKELYEFEEAA